MQSALENAIHALRVYLKRGQEVLQAIAGGDLDSVEEALRLRGAAFHNFRVQDVAAAEAGFDIGLREDARSVFSQIQDQNLVIVEAYNRYRKIVQRELVQLGRKKKVMGRYRSRAKTISKFAKSV